MDDSQRAVIEGEYLELVREGDTHRKLNAIRQLQDEIDGLVASAARCEGVFEAVDPDDEGQQLAAAILVLAGHLRGRQQAQLHGLKTLYGTEKRLARK